ncbi:DUF7281 domain-containing protein [Polynucleobacter rarus]|uniref:DUF7281 domain-containing protein n=1 Tax=Polynucleobacter rarus TaxID=556055 RepID=UPI000D3E770A|nr:hypothetical protein [Polynucleobacter rarus]
MEKNLINSLLRIYHGEKDRYAASGVLTRLMEDFNIGQRVGTSIVFSNNDRDSIRKLLATEGIDVETTQLGQWQELSRTDSLEFSHNEKMTNASVRQGRVAVKALPGNLLWLGDEKISLPISSNLDIDWRWLVGNCDHTSVLLVENWEAFDRIHEVTFDLSQAGKNPLVVFRGSPVYRQDYVIALLNVLALPVFAFVDLDPSGLILAQSTPHFEGLMVPPTLELVSALKSVKNYSRYRSQLIQSQSILNNSTHPDIVKHWKLLQEYGTALPQEYFLMKRTS